MSLGRGPLVLAGFMGTGKTVVGRRLASLLGRRFVDCDRLVARSMGFGQAGEALAAKGEKAFREAEASAIPPSLRAGTVVALGGGSHAVTDVAAAIAGLQVACLTAPLPELERRLGDWEGRPLWPHRERLFRQRRTAPGVQVATMGLSVGAVAGRVLRSLGSTRAAPLGRGGRVLMGWGAMALPIPESEFVLVHDARLGGLLADLPQGPVAAVPLPGGDRAKTWAALGNLLGDLGEAGLDRGGAVVGFGGGGVTDAVGVAAGLYLRGISLHLVPSTLLGMADAALGGKFAVNAGGLKNRVGLFRPAESVRLDPTLLAGLPPAEMRSGLAEVVKASWLAPASRDRLAPDLQRMARGRLASLERGIRVAARAKLTVVRADPEERSGQRALLNFGHTLGHALESVAKPRPRHGEAVAAGMLAVARWAERTGRAERGTAAAMEADLTAAGIFPRPAPGPYDAERMAEAVAGDKKRRGGRAVVVVPVAPGRLALEEMSAAPVAEWLEALG